MAISDNIMKILYTSRDYLSIYEDLTNSISTITQKWTSREETDPGIVLVKLMSMLGDMLSYNQDKMALEVYPGSVTQRKNAAQIFSLLGYKMKWYRSAICKCNVVNTYPSEATLPRFSIFKTNDSSINYTNFSQYELPSNSTNNGEEMIVELVQGVPVTPTRKSNKTVPGSNEPWHVIYNYNVNVEDITDRRIYLSYENVDQDHIVLIDDAGDEWELVDDVALQISTGKFYELRVDEFDRPYLYLTNYWENFDVTKFKLFYIRSNGENGEIANNTITGIDSMVYCTIGVGGSQQVYNVTSYIQLTNTASTYGYNPQTPEEARNDSANYINTLDTLITLDDFRKAVLRIEGVANCIATDCTTDPGLVHVEMYGDINMDGKIDAEDYALLDAYIDDPTNNKLTDNQRKLCDLDKDGFVTGDDLVLLQNFIQGDYEHAGVAGDPCSLFEGLDTYIVNIYIQRTIEKEDEDADSFISKVQTLLKNYKMMPLTINVLMEDHINKYYWTVEGSVYTKTPYDQDEAQDLLVAINNQLIYEYSPEKIDFNSTVKYIDVVNTILNTDNKIQHVDLQPIKYYDEEGNVIDAKEITGKYETIAYPETGTTKFTIKLDNVPIKPGTVVMNVEAGAYTLRDNSNGKITDSGKNVLVESGTIDYNSGEISFEMNTPFTTYFTIQYTQNKINLVKYMNFTTGKFALDVSSLKS